MTEQIILWEFVMSDIRPSIEMGFLNDLSSSKLEKNSEYFIYAVRPFQYQVLVFFRLRN